MPLEGKPNVHYFNLGNRGRGEVIRLFFHEAGIEYNDHRIEMSEWPKVKEDFLSKGITISGTIPVVEINGKYYTQSVPMLRYFSAKLNKYNGSNLDEAYLADQIADIAIDWRAAWVSSLSSNSNDHEIKVVPKFLQIFNKFLVAKGGPYVLGKELCYADILVYQFLHDDGLLSDKSKIEGFEGLKKFVKAFEARPNVAKYLEFRKKYNK